VFGFFIQVFDMFRQTDDDPGLVVDLDGENGLTPEKMVEIAKEYGFDIPVLDRRMAFN
jgi:ABC-type microcin C transport system permease subunit YejB